MNDKRLQATIVIWTAFTVIMAILAAIISEGGSTLSDWAAAMIFTIAMSLTVGVTITTTTIWKAGAENRSSNHRTASSKTKRDYRRVDRLIADLDEDELYELESRLLAHDEQRH